MQLTRDTKTSTDWSADRINNNGAYAPGNIVVLSAKANRAKGNKTFDDIWTLASGPSPTDELSQAATGARCSQ